MTRNEPTRLQVQNTEREHGADDGVRCDVLILVATSTEEKELKRAAKEMGLRFDKRAMAGPHGDHLEFFSLARVGDSTVYAVRTDLGPLSYEGSASTAVRYQIVTSANAIVQLGMAFGVDPMTQKIGDVLVSTSIIPYDLREVRAASAKSVELPRDMLLAEQALDANDVLEPEGASPQKANPEPEMPPPVSTPAMGNVRGQDAPHTPPPAEHHPDECYVVDYRWAVRHRAKASLIEMCKAELRRGACTHGVYFGGLLSGGARIRSRKFLGELMRGVPQADDGIVGGEMEGVGLLSVSPPEDPLWIVVKGISDFGDKDRDSAIVKGRPLACRNAAQFVLSALKYSSPSLRTPQEPNNEQA